VFVQIHSNKVVRDPSSQTDDRFAAACWIPGDANSRFPISPLALHAGLAVKSWITWVAEARRGRRNDCALHAFVKLLETEVVNVTILELHRHEGSPPDTVIECEFPRRF